MSEAKIKENLVYKKDLVLKNSADIHLEEHEYLLSKTTYNQEGKTISEIQYDSSGNVLQEYLYKYNDKGQVIEEIMRDGDGFDAEHTSYEMDDNGRIKKELRHYMDETYDTIQYSYVDDKLTKKECCDFDGDLESIEEFEYKDGLLVSRVVKDEGGEILSEKKMLYDEQKNLLEEYIFDGEQGTTFKRVNEYYSSGNKKSVLTYNNEGDLIGKVLLEEDDKEQVVKVIEESTDKKNTVLMTYDDHGNVVYQEELDRNNNLVSKVERAYDENNMLMNSQVYIDGAGRSISRNYTLRQEYVFYPAS